MKKIYLTLLLLIPAFFLNAQGPIKLWNDQLDTFIEIFNQVDPALEQLYSDNGISSFTFTYFDPESGNVIKEATVFDNGEFEKVNDELLSKAKSIVIGHLADALKKNNKMNTILNEFTKKNADIVLLYTTEVNGNKLKKQIAITPAEIKRTN